MGQPQARILNASLNLIFSHKKTEAVGRVVSGFKIVIYVRYVHMSTYFFLGAIMVQCLW